MAVCNKEVTQVPKTIMVDGPPEYLLKLDIEEAKFLYDILRQVGGDPNKSRRRLADSIYNAICGYRKDFGRQHSDSYATDIAIQDCVIYCEESDEH